MANKNLFQSTAGRLLPQTNAVNAAGGTAYGFEARHALAQYAATGCLNQIYYASAERQLDDILRLTKQLEPEFIARAALYARSQGHMKDLPALLTAVLSVRSPGLMAEVFDRVIDSPKMLRNFVQIVRSGVAGRKSLGSLPKRMVRQWIDRRTDEQLFSASVGNDPSLADILKMVHPKPRDERRAALFGYLIGRPVDAEALPDVVKRYEAYKQAKDRKGLETPDVPFQLLTALELPAEAWKSIARHATWQTTRMNLNTFHRHGVLSDPVMVELIAQRLRNPALVRQARVFPYQLLSAYLSTSDALPRAIRDALQDALDVALENVPEVDGQVYVLPDVSGSMHSPVTGYRRGSTTAVRCVDVAALVAAAMLRKNTSCRIIPFECDVVPERKLRLNPRDSVMTNAAKLAGIGGGGTNCSAPLKHLNDRKAHGDLVVYVSDNESWMDSRRGGFWPGSATETLKQWEVFKRRNPRAKLICIDIQPNTSTQAQERSDVINVAGFSDQVFHLIAAVAAGRASAGHWVEQIEQVRL